tara:strand:- start:571 stop:972 length:402 start_codon:yes stop_codon:yes gene_type:complete
LKFFIGKSLRFTSWILPQLRPEWYDEEEFFFRENDQINNFVFLVKGKAQFVLPEYKCLPYINIGENNHFGLIDIVGSAKCNGFDIHDWFANYYSLKRLFTIRAKHPCDVLLLDIHRIKSMAELYPRDFNTIFG